MKLLEKHLSTRISMGKRHCNLGIYWSKAGLLLVLAMYVCACGNRQRNGTPTQANDSIIVEVPQQVGVGSILPVTVTGESDFEIKKVQITGTSKIPVPEVMNYGYGLLPSGISVYFPASINGIGEIPRKEYYQHMISQIIIFISSI